MKHETVGTIIIVTGGVAFLLGFILGVYLSQSAHSTTYNNTQAATDCATTLNRCMEGWRETLDTLNSCNNFIK